MRILVSSDWHLDAVTAGLPRFDELTERIDEIVERVVDEMMVDLFLNLGDLCDPDPLHAHRCIAYAAAKASNLNARKIPNAWLVGNHDVMEDGDGTSTLSAITGWADGGSAEHTFVFDEPSWRSFGDVLLVALPYVPRAKNYNPDQVIDDIAEAVEDDGYKHILVIGHLTVAGARMASETFDMPRGRDIVYPVESIRRRWGKRATMLNGHYHRGQTTPSGVIIPGALARLAFDEADNDPGFMLLDLR